MTLIANSRTCANDTAFSTEDFARISAYARKHFGLNLSANKMPLVYSRLTRRLRSLQISCFADYFSLLESSESGAEKTKLLSVLTTNVTHFFREVHHFDTLKDEVLPNLIKKSESGGRVRIWSAGCSSGEEPYSISMVINSLFPKAADRDIRVLGTDIDPEIIRVATNAKYSPDVRASIPERFRGSWYDEWSCDVAIPQAVSGIVRLGVLNLIEPFPFSGKFDAIFCRNVAIYFDKPTQAALWSAFRSVLNPGGYLFLGHSERLSGPATKNFLSSGITTYRHASRMDMSND